MIDAAPGARGKRARSSRSAALDGALDQLRDTDKNVQFFFSGDEPLREELEIEERLSHLEPWPNVRVHYIPGTVHTLRPFVTQMSATDMFNRALAERDPAPRGGRGSRRGQVVLMISTEQGAWWETLLGTEPSRKRLAPVIPLLPTTTRSASCSSATSRIASAGSP